jgi:type IV pilus assembly protein PilV
MKKISSQSNAACQRKQSVSFLKNGRNNGFSLIEVLVAIVVLSIGLLGLAGLQTAGLKANNSAYQRTQASILANEMLDRMRANRVGLQASLYDDPYAGGTPADPGCSTSGCSVANMADYDVYYWETSLSNTLPSGQGAITGNGAGSIFTITVMWDDNRSGVSGTGCDTGNPLDLTCFVMSTRL